MFYHEEFMAGLFVSSMLQTAVAGQLQQRPLPQSNWQQPPASAYGGQRPVSGHQVPVYGGQQPASGHSAPAHESQPPMSDHHFSYQQPRYRTVYRYPYFRTRHSHSRCRLLKLEDQLEWHREQHREREWEQEQEIRDLQHRNWELLAEIKVLNERLGYLKQQHPQEGQQIPPHQPSNLTSNVKQEARDFNQH